MKIEYHANNSGGRWWLTDKDWRALEAAGWEVHWGGEYFCHSKYPSLNRKPAGAPEPCASGDACPGHRCYASADAVPAEGRFLGAIARSATKEFNTEREAIHEWENATGQDASDEGCNCCGPPHSFSWDGGCVSGEDVVGVLYNNAPTSLREAARLLSEAP